MALTKWLPPTHRHTIEGDQGRVTWLELFFDLVYVAALIQLGDQLSGDVTWGGIGRFLAIFALLWWTWTGTTAYTNRFAVDDVLHRILVLVQMFAVANVALLAVGPNEDRWAWMAVAYVAARLPLLAMYARMLPEGGPTAALARIYLIAFGAGAALWAVSIALPEPARFVVWGVAVVVEFATPVVVVGKLTGPPTHEHHFRERYAIFTIIVFGETFVKTLTELADRGLSLESQIYFGLISLAAAALWWTYFDDVADSNVRPGHQLFRLGWVYSHLPLAAALTAFGVASKKVVDIDSFGEAVYQPYLWLLAGSIAATLVATAGLDLLTVSPHFAVGPWLRVGPRLVAAVGVLAVALVLDQPALVAVTAVTALAVGQIALEVVIASRADRVVAERIQQEIATAGAGCADLSTTVPLPAPADPACPVCVEKGKQWVELRQCQTCGHVGCCDDTPGQHARSHWESTGHPVMASIESGAQWAYCYVHHAIDDPWSARTLSSTLPPGEVRR